MKPRPEDILSFAGVALGSTHVECRLQLSANVIYHHIRD
jgi:hypothetical protein